MTACCSILLPRDVVLRLALISLELSQSVGESLMPRQFHRLAMASVRDALQFLYCVRPLQQRGVHKARWLIRTLTQDCADGANAAPISFSWIRSLVRTASMVMP